MKHNLRMLLLVGCGSWLLFVMFAPRASAGLLIQIENILLLAVLVHVPLALRLMKYPDGSEWKSLWFELASRLQPVAAACVAVALLIPTGVAALLLSLPWLIFSALLAIHALRWLWLQGGSLRLELALCAASLFLPIGAAWLASYRLGYQPLDFPLVIVLLTAVHFHFTGFVLPVTLWLIGDFLQSQAALNLPYRFSAGGSIVATPLIAAGITASPTLEIVGVVVLVSAIATLVWVVVGHVTPRIQPTSARWLVTFSWAALLVAIAFALFYGLGEYLGQQWLTIPQMVLLHGWTNAIGFGLCGLIGWNLSKVARANSRTVISGN